MATKSSIQHILTPETEKRFFTDQILPPLLKGENLTIIRVPHSGSRKQMEFLIENSDHFGYRKLGKPILVYINPHELPDISPEGYFKLMYHYLNPSQSVESDATDFFFKLKKEIMELVRKGFHLVFILGEFNGIDFPISFFNNLHSLHQINRNRISFIFMITTNIFDGDKIKNFGELAKLLGQNIAYFPILSPDDTKTTVKRLVHEYSYQISESTINLVTRLAGGHPSLIKSCLSAIGKSPEVKDEVLLNFLQNQWEIKIILEDIWNTLTESEKRILLQISNKTSDHFQLTDYLLNLGVVSEDNHYSFFSPLFESYVKNQRIENNIITIDKKTGEILVNGSSPKEKITLTEYHLLSAFLEKPNTLISRDQIAEILWGKDAYNKYSDWAIDQNISLLRKKLEKIGITSEILQTIKGRGYRWTI